MMAPARISALSLAENRLALTMKRLGYVTLCAALIQRQIIGL